MLKSFVSVMLLVNVMPVSAELSSLNNVSSSGLSGLDVHADKPIERCKRKYKTFLEQHIISGILTNKTKDSFY
jgi:hypothetical protein